LRIDDQTFRDVSMLGRIKNGKCLVNKISTHLPEMIKQRISGSKTNENSLMSGKVVLHKWLHMAPRQEKEFVRFDQALFK